MSRVRAVGLTEVDVPVGVEVKRRKYRTASATTELIPFLTVVLLALCVFSIESAGLVRGNFPPIPLMPWTELASVVGAVGLLAFAVMYLGWLAAYFGPSIRGFRDLARKSLPWLGLCATGFLFIRDQHWLQPWAWQAFLIFLIDLCFKGDDDKRTWWRRLACSVYLFSAMSKFDIAFFDHLGKTIVTRGLAPAVGIDTALWSRQFTRAVVFLLPLTELAAAVCLSRTSWRRVGLGLATAVHLGLLLALGPFGLDHHAGVLIWNVFFLTHIWILFWPGKMGDEADDVAGDSKQENAKRPRWATVVVGGVLLLPALEPVGLFDHWPGWSVYSNRSPVIRIEVAFPRPVEDVDWVAEPLPLSDFQIISLSGWSFAAWRSPSYPQERFQLGVCRALLDKLPEETPFRVRVLTYSGDRTGRATERVYETRDQLDARLREFWLPTAAGRWELPAVLAEAASDRDDLP